MSVRSLLVLLILVAAAVTVPATQAGAATTGLSVTARWALLGDTPATVVLVGRYTCGPFAAGTPRYGTVDLSVDQVVDGVTTHAIGYLTPTACDGAPHWYAAELTAFSGGLRRGAAAWTASGYVQADDGFQSFYAPPTRIRIG